MRSPHINQLLYIYKAGRPVSDFNLATSPAFPIDRYRRVQGGVEKMADKDISNHEDDHHDSERKGTLASINLNKNAEAR